MDKPVVDRVVREMHMNEVVERAVASVNEIIFNDMHLTHTESRLAWHLVIKKLMVNEGIWLQAPVIKEWLGLK